MVRQPVLARIDGTTQKFGGNGRKLGYATANISTTTKLADGVYFGYADLADYANQPALVFIGTPVTIGDKGRRLEAHLLDITDQDYYGEILRVSVHHYHRGNQKFDSINQLKTAMKDDEQAARQWLKNHKRQ